VLCTSCTPYYCTVILLSQARFAIHYDLLCHTTRHVMLAVMLHCLTLRMIPGMEYSPPLIFPVLLTASLFPGRKRWSFGPVPDTADSYIRLLSKASHGCQLEELKGRTGEVQRVLHPASLRNRFGLGGCQLDSMYGASERSYNR
jgi:hypothetical protein